MKACKTEGKTLTDVCSTAARRRISHVRPAAIACSVPTELSGPSIGKDRTRRAAATRNWGRKQLSASFITSKVVHL